MAYIETDQEKLEAALKSLDLEIDGTIIPAYKQSRELTFRIRSTKTSAWRQKGAGGKFTTMVCVHGIRQFWQAVAERVSMTELKTFNPFDSVYDKTLDKDISKAFALGCDCPVKNEKQKDPLYIPPELQENLEKQKSPSEIIDTDQEIRKAVAPNPEELINQVVIAYRAYNLNPSTGLAGFHSVNWPDRRLTAECESTPGIGYGYSNQTKVNNFDISYRWGQQWKHKRDTLLGYDKERVRRFFTGDPDPEPEQENRKLPETITEKHLNCVRHLMQRTCQCGIWAYSSPTNHSLTATTIPNRLVAKVVLYGTILVGDNGYRASNARIEELWLIKGKEDPFAGPLRTAYQDYYKIPVHAVTLEEWVEAAKALEPTDPDLLLTA